MTPPSRHLHPSNGCRAPSGAEDVVVPISHATRKSQEQLKHRTSEEQGEELAASSAGPSDSLDGNVDGNFDEDLDDAEEYPAELHRQILDMMSAGCDDEIIARRLGLDLSTYKGMVAELAATVGACNRFQLALNARDLGWV